MRVLVVIPARYGSQRFPGKPLADIAGVPMVVRVLHNVQTSLLANRVVVATDDQRIADVVHRAGGEAVMTSADLPTGSDRVWAVAADDSADVIVNVQGDEPLLPGGVVDLLVERLRDFPQDDIATPVVSMSKASSLAEDAVTVARDENGAALYFSRSVIPFGADPVWRHVGVYAYRRSALQRFVSAAPIELERVEKLEQLRALTLGLRIAAVPVLTDLQSVDRPGDVLIVEDILRGGPSRSSDIRLVVLDVDGVLTSGDIAYLGDDAQLLTFNVKDGHGIVELQRAGIRVAIISARDSPALRRRASELGVVDVYSGVSDKAASLQALCASLAVPLTEVCYVGDDDPDIPAFKLAGLTAAPADAARSVLALATITLRASGGRGAVRELAELLLARQQTQAR